MKREDLKALGLEDAAIDAIMKFHGQDIETLKANNTTLLTERDTFKGQLDEASQAIESFKAMKPNELKAAADEWKMKAEKAQTDAVAQVAKVKFDYALDNELKNTYKARDIVAVRAHLKAEAIQYADDKFIGLKEQIEPLKASSDFLFENDAPPPPRIVSGGGNQPVIGDVVTNAMRTAAGLK
jgi:chromosome segregation ATPase